MIEPPPEQYVLCLDDDAEFIKSLEAFLPAKINAGNADGLWYRFVFLQDPEEALELLGELVSEKAQVAMLISDQQMPTMKGIELLRRAREMSPESMRILLTGHAGIEAAITAINDRLLDRYLTKPIEDENDFTLNVRQLLQHYEMRGVIETQALALQDLYRFANTINAMGDLGAMLGYVAHYAQSVLGCDQAAIAIEAPDGVHSATAGLPNAPESWERGAWAASAAPTVGAASAVQALPSEIVDVARAVGLDPSRPIAFARLSTDGTSDGLILAGGRPKPFRDSDLEMLGYIADTASIAIHKQIVWGQLGQANERLARLDEMKSEFLRFISHELRTPLSYMSAIGLLDRPLEPADWQEMGNVIQRGYQRLDAFIKAGLDYFSWCGRGPVETHEQIDWRQLLTTDHIEKMVPGAGVRILGLPDRPCVVKMAQGTAESILRILIENAIKFSPDGPSIEMELSMSGDRMRLAVKDRGRGFESGMGPELFRPFTVIDTLHHREGTGLSLAKTAAMVEAHGGCIQAQSEGRGQGATFVLELPLHRPESGIETHDGSAQAEAA